MQVTQITSLTIRLGQGHDDEIIINKKSSTGEIGVIVHSTAKLQEIFAKTEEVFSKIDPSLPKPITFQVKRIKFKGVFEDFGYRLMIPIHIKHEMLDKGMKPEIVLSNCRVGAKELDELKKLARENKLNLSQAAKTVTYYKP